MFLSQCSYFGIFSGSKRSYFVLTFYKTRCFIGDIEYLNNNI